jgi:cephalosporin-C deacetylase-like acetyl esterase
MRSVIGTLLNAAVFAGLLLTSTINEGNAMNANLACPYGDTCSPPQTPSLSFRSPQSEDMLFTSGEELGIICQAGLRAVGMKWTLHRNMVDTPFREGIAEALPANRFVIAIPTAGLHPGFYDLRVELDSGVENAEREPLKKRPVRGVCTFGWKADRMAIAENRPADFTAFWDEAKAKLANIPLDARDGSMQTFGPKELNEYNRTRACLPPDYDPKGHKCETVESGKVDFAGPDGGRVYGWLAKPAGTGPFPAMLVLPGAGFAARPRPLEHARHGYVALDIQVHGQEVDLKEYPKLPGYDDHIVYAPASAYYYYHVYLRCLQALRYLRSRPDVDPTRLVVVGGSQGGRLAVVLAGLDPHVAAAVPCIAWGANQPHLRWVARLNGYAIPGDSTPDPSVVPGDGMDVTGAPPLVNEPIDRCLAYYDPMHFAPDATCPALFNAGLIDPVSPPYSVFAAFSRWGGKEKTMVALDGLGHDWSAAFDRRAWRWLDAILETGKQAYTHGDVHGSC